MSKIEAVIPFVMPTLGGLAGVIIVNLNPRELLNPMYWVGGGIVLGFIAARLLLTLMRRWG
ncbi:hypothetical protein [Aliiroseovarius lamellibrachiae]|uniref:hypothetical protein n=1 Tax=Aliiroseovarius lamellibrachiae TaxID=1924933 RepID=UPI001FECC80D|nr:hypothetical protein [Aliiroseovarius lamellibrachiae]